jgi:hypothetical protein
VNGMFNGLIWSFDFDLRDMSKEVCVSALLSLLFHRMKTEALNILIKVPLGGGKYKGSYRCLILFLTNILLKVQYFPSWDMAWNMTWHIFWRHWRMKSSGWTECSMVWSGLLISIYVTCRRKCVSLLSCLCFFIEWRLCKSTPRRWKI